MLENKSSLPWCIMGDFNDLLYDLDKWGDTPRPRWMLEGFRSAIEDSHLAELDLNSEKFTWEKSKGKPGWVKERLDRCFASQSWWGSFSFM